MVLTLAPPPYTRDNRVTAPGAGSGQIDSLQVDSLYVDSIHVKYRQANSAA
jgi:hypothetical protein